MQNKREKEKCVIFQVAMYIYIKYKAFKSKKVSANKTRMFEFLFFLDLCAIDISLLVFLIVVIEAQLLELILRLSSSRLQRGQFFGQLLHHIVQLVDSRIHFLHFAVAFLLVLLQQIIRDRFSFEHEYYGRFELRQQRTIIRVQIGLE